MIEEKNYIELRFEELLRKGPMNEQVTLLGAWDTPGIPLGDAEFKIRQQGCVMEMLAEQVRMLTERVNVLMKLTEQRKYPRRKLL